jgi:aryl-alcohol dehydrogenase-like predicted oxidoreductase
LLSGKYFGQEKARQGRIVEKEQYTKRYSNPRYYEIAQEFVAYADTLGVKPAALALRWVMANPAVTAPIIGARSLSQLEDSLGVQDLHVTPEILEHITKLSDTPPNATDRLEEELDAGFKLRNR